MKVKVTQPCLTLYDPMDYIVHGIPQARILEWVAFSFSRDIPNPGIEPRSPSLLWTLHQLSHKGSPDRQKELSFCTVLEELTHWKRLWCWEGLGAGGEGDNRGWDGWIASPTRWTWVWVNSRSWWWTGSCMLQFMALQRVGHDWATELNWTELTHSIYFSNAHQMTECFLQSKAEDSIAICLPSAIITLHSLVLVSLHWKPSHIICSDQIMAVVHIPT